MKIEIRGIKKKKNIKAGTNNEISLMMGLKPIIHT